MQAEVAETAGRGEKLPSSQFNNALSALLLEEEVLQILPKGSRKTYYVRNQATLDDFLYNRFNVSNLSLYVETLEKEDLLRADLARQVGDTKIRPVRSFKGFWSKSPKWRYGFGIAASQRIRSLLCVWG